ncbi:MAG: hypothetical protein K1X55_14535 [Chitinophagales bacterium]|nr:hypothetical protein [Chitinophagales bacterium]
MKIIEYILYLLGAIIGIALMIHHIISSQKIRRISKNAYFADGIIQRIVIHQFENFSTKQAEINVVFNDNTMLLNEQLPDNYEHLQEGDTVPIIFNSTDYSEYIIGTSIEEIKHRSNRLMKAKILAIVAYFVLAKIICFINAYFYNKV